MSLILNGTSGITFPNSTVQASAGTVLQVVNATYSTLTTNNTSTQADTGLTISITPKFATSKILVTVFQAGLAKTASNNFIELFLYRDATQILKIEGAAANDGGTGSNYIGASGATYLDSPATTSAVTYKTKFDGGANTAAVHCQINGATSTITVMEIAG